MEWAKALPQVSHLKGRSPVWLRMWRTRCAEWPKALGHSVHLKGRSPVWLRMCAASLLLEGKPLPQTEQGSTFFTRPRRPLTAGLVVVALAPAVGLLLLALASQAGGEGAEVVATAGDGRLGVARY